MFIILQKPVGRRILCELGDMQVYHQFSLQAGYPLHSGRILDVEIRNRMKSYNILTMNPKVVATSSFILSPFFLSLSFTNSVNQCECWRIFRRYSLRNIKLYLHLIFFFLNLSVKMITENLMMEERVFLYNLMLGESPTVLRELFLLLWKLFAPTARPCWK